jgi:uncharacterized membrane protein
MSKLTWSGAIVWGAFVAGFGLNLIDPGSAELSASGVQQAQQAVVMLAAGIVTVLVGAAGLIDLIARMPRRH